MSFSYTLYKNKKIKTFVPPHPFDNLDFFGSKPDLANKLGKSEEGISASNDNWKTMNDGIQILLKNGWVPLQKRNPYYVDHIRKCLAENRYKKPDIAIIRFCKIFFDIYNKNDQKVLKLFGIKITFKRK